MAVIVRAGCCQRCCQTALWSTVAGICATSSNVSMIVRGPGPSTSKPRSAFLKGWHRDTVPIQAAPFPVIHNLVGRSEDFNGSPHLTGLVVWPGYPESLSVCDGV